MCVISRICRYYIYIMWYIYIYIHILSTLIKSNPIVFCPILSYLILSIYPSPFLVKYICLANGQLAFTSSCFVFDSVATWSRHQGDHRKYDKQQKEPTYHMYPHPSDTFMALSLAPFASSSVAKAAESPQEPSNILDFNQRISWFFLGRLMEYMNPWGVRFQGM